jgi:hypothetical protein
MWWWQAQKLEPPMQYIEDLEGQALRECLPSISGTSLLGKALVLLAGVHSIVQEDSSLVVTTLEGSNTVAALPVVPGDIVYEVASRSCSWYKGMVLEDIISHLQVYVLFSLFLLADGHALRLLALRQRCQRVS